MLKLLLAASLALVPVSAPSQQETPSLPVIEPSAIVQVICVNLPYIMSGTAFRVGKLYLSVKHVTSNKNCSISGKPIKIVYQSPTQDFTILSSDSGPFIPIDCAGFVKGRRYLAVGFARGQSPATVVEITATGEKSGPWSVLTGMLTVIPGMSGGAIVSEDTGKAVGLVNVENFEAGWSGSLALSDTPICHREHPAATR